MRSGDTGLIKRDGSNVARGDDIYQLWFIQEISFVVKAARVVALSETVFVKAKPIRAELEFTRFHSDSEAEMLSSNCPTFV